MDWFWLVIFAGLMFLMHRFGMGCCGVHSHGEHSGHQHGQEKERPPERASEPAKGTPRAELSAGGNGAGMNCCGGHAQRGPGEVSRTEGAKALPRPEGEEEKGRPALTALRPEAGERKGDG